MTASKTKDFDALVRRTWKKGMKTDDLKYKSYKSSVGIDKGIPFEARYLPSLEEKSKEAEEEDDDDEDDDDDEEEEKQQDAEEEKGVEKKTQASKSGRDLPDGHVDAEEEKGVETRDESHDKVEEGHDDIPMDPEDDPFLPPRKNVITQVPPEYTCMLNKYSLERGHFLVVTNDFFPQYGPVRRQDLVMLHDVVQRPKNRMYAFLNGGPDAGASQEHRHFQFMEVPDLKEPVYPDAIYQKNPKATTPQSHPDLPVAHFLLPILDSSPDALEKSWNTLYKLAQETAGSTDEKLPFNFLITKEYMMILPRQNNHWHEDIGIGGTCLVGSIPVEDEKLIDDVRKAGIIEILSHIGYPTKN